MLRGRRTSPTWRRTSACARGMVRTFQINQLFDSLTPLETLALVVSQQPRRGRRWWQPLGARRRRGRRAASSCWSSSA